MANNNESGDQGDGTFLNPVLRGNYADPSIIRVGSEFYMVNTSYKYVPGLIIWQSKDMVNWQPIGAALTEVVGDVWAPEFVHYQDRFYIYFPANKTNWVVYADYPEGPWSKPINLYTSLIDPGHVVGPDKKRYLHLSGGHIVQLADDGLSTVGEVQKVYEAWKYPADWEVEAFSPEGPKLRYHNGYYYLTIAVGGTAGPPTSHMVVASRSKTPWGPWEHAPHNPILRTDSKHEKWWSQGHGTIIDTPDGDWWMIYHAYENQLHTLGRHTMLLPIEWTEDGWYKIADGARPDQPIRKPIDSPATYHGFSIEDRFEENSLGLHWQWLGETARDSIKVENNALTFTGTKGETISPILYMAAHPCYEVEVDVKVEGDAEARFLLYYDQKSYFGISVSTEGLRHIRTFKRYHNEAYEGNVVRLKIRNDHNIISFYYMQHEAWVKYDKVIDSSGYHHNTFGGFLSLRIGLDMVQAGKATFSNFTYRVL